MAVIDREVRELDESDLSWGRYTEVGTSTQRVGAATQRFAINVALGPTSQHPVSHRSSGEWSSRGGQGQA